MTKLEKHVLAHVLDTTKNPSAPSRAYDENFQPVKVDRLVADIPNHELLEWETYRAGYRKAWDEISQHIEWLFLSGQPVTREEMIRFAGKPSK